MGAALLEWCEKPGQHGRRSAATGSDLLFDNGGLPGQA